MENKKLRVFAFADLHGDSKRAEALAEAAYLERADLTVLCGDITGLVDSKNLIKPFKNRGQRVLLIPGNWDSLATTDFLANFYGMKNIHGYSAVYDKVGFFGAGGADIGPFNAVSEKELMETLEKAYSGLKGVEKKVMLTHMHPSGSRSEFSGLKGSKSIRKAIEKFKPDVLIHGHIHEGSGFEERIGNTRVINVARKGILIEI